MNTPLPLSPTGADPLFTRERRRVRMQQFLATFERSVDAARNPPLHPVGAKALAAGPARDAHPEFP